MSDPHETDARIPSAGDQPPVHHHRELEEIVRKAVGDALQAHVCRFTREEAAMLHGLGKLSDDNLDAIRIISKLPAEQLSTLARLARTLNAATDRISQAILIALVALAAWVLYRLSEAGIIQP